MEHDKYNLIVRPKEELIDMITELMSKLTVDERLAFISKRIDPQAALEEAIGKNSDVFMESVNSFCSEIMSMKYSPDEDDDYFHEYDDFYDYPEDTDYSESEWAADFEALLDLAVLYSRNRNHDIAYSAFERLLSCINEAELDEQILGTDYPCDYINVDWDEVFKEYFASMMSEIRDEAEAAQKAIGVWLSFSELSTEALVDSFNEITYVEEAIRTHIGKNANEWRIQHDLYELLKLIYANLGIQFDDVTVPSSLVPCNFNFMDDLAEGYINQGMLEQAIMVLRDALKIVTDEEVMEALNEKLSDSYERMGMLSEAYEVAVRMYLKGHSHDQYIRARSLASEIGCLEDFIQSVTKSLQSDTSNGADEALLVVLSYEGLTSMLVKATMQTEGFYTHSFLKYSAKSLIYRALRSSENIVLPDLKAYLQSIENNEIPGITDMVNIQDEPENNGSLLDSAIEVIKRMVQFHIEAGERSRYARAAYYCSLIRDICSHKNENDVFAMYYNEIWTRNNRRSALKNELMKKLGYAGVNAKK